MVTDAQPLPGSPSNQRMFRAALICVFAAALALAVPMFQHVVLYGLVAVMALMIILPAWSDMQKGRMDYFEPIHILGALYFCFFGCGAIWTVHFPHVVAFDRYITPFVLEATFYCVIGYAALLLGYYGPWAPRKPQRHVEQIAHVAFLLIPGLLGISGYIGMSITNKALSSGGGFSAVTSTLAQLRPLFLFAWAMAWQQYFSGQSSKSQRVALFGLFVPATLFFIWLSASGKAVTMNLIGIPVIAYWYARGKLRWDILIALVLILIFVIFPFYNTIRNFDPLADRSTAINETMIRVSEWSSENYLDRSVYLFMKRMSLINSVAVVVRDVGRWVPYAKGETLVGSFTFFIPRLLWPDKPSFMLGREFGIKFRVVGALDKSTSISATVPGELYWNFDVPGVLIGMALLGYAMRYIYRRYGDGKHYDPVRRAILMVVLIEIATTIGGHSAQLVATVRTLIIIEVLRWWARQFGLLRWVRPSQMK